MVGPVYKAAVLFMVWGTEKRDSGKISTTTVSASATAMATCGSSSCPVDPAQGQNPQPQTVLGFRA